MILAVDGGNSKTDLALVEADGSLVAHARGPLSSPHHLGLDGCLAVLQELVDRAGLNGRRADVAQVLLAGVDFPDEEERVAFAKAAQRLTEAAEEDDGRATLEVTLGPIVDRLLLRKGIAAVDPECRPVLLNAFRMALQDAFANRERNAAGDYTPDPNAARFPEWGQGSVARGAAGSGGGGGGDRDAHGATTTKRNLERPADCTGPHVSRDTLHKLRHGGTGALHRTDKPE